MQMLTPVTEMKKAKNKKFWSWRAGIFDKFCTCWDAFLCIQVEMQVSNWEITQDQHQKCIFGTHQYINGGMGWIVSL